MIDIESKEIRDTEENESDYRGTPNRKKKERNIFE